MDPVRWRRVCDLFEAALERDPADRGALLAAIDDQELRREVDSLLTAHDASGAIDRLAPRMERLRTEALESRLSDPTSTQPITHGIAPGRRLGRHEIRARLGSGGMGEVYRSYDTRLEREVAIKILGRQLLEHPGALQRFEQEARAASALNHPNIITVYDIGEDASFPYIVMELVDGETLRRMLHDPWPLELLLVVAIQVADGLVAAHERGIVHRDLKPENVLVSREWVVKIVDFGLAQFGVVRELIETPTKTGGIQGTLGYIAPEILAGVPADARSDQFSFGAIVYEMAAGAPSFSGGTTLETISRSMRGDPRPLSECRPDLPLGFVQIVDRCLRKDPLDRFPSTRDLLNELRAVQRAPVNPSARPRPARRPASLPAQRTRLIGRQRELAEIHRLLRGGVRLLTLTGAGGTGKTRLAVRAAETLEAERPGGVIFVPLAAISDPALVVTAIAQALGVVVSATQPALARIISDLRSTNARTLLVLDNFEQVIPAAPLVGELLSACPDLEVLVTSREVLHLYGEHGLPVSPLTPPDPAFASSPEPLAQCPAVALFLERAQAANPDFRLTADNARAVAELCAGLDGLPLALELAAAHARLLSPEAMVARFDTRLGLAAGARDVPGRQKTLRRTMDWSHQLLSDTEKAVFRRLALFAGGFTLESAEAVVDPFGKLGLTMEEAVSALADKSLLETREPLDGEPRFAMLQTLREYALEKLIESGELERTHRVHAAYFLVLAEEGSPAVSSSEPPTWLKRFETEHDNFRVALDWLMRQREAEWGLRMALALFPFWERGEHLPEGRRRLEALLELDCTRSLPAQRARALFAAGVLASTQRDIERGWSLHRESLEIYRELGDLRGVVVALVALANHHVARGDYDAASGVLEQSLMVWDALGDRAGFARSLANLAFVARCRGRFEEAREIYQRAEEVFEHVGDRLSRAWAVDHEGDVAREQDDLVAAEALYRHALQVFQQLGDRWGIGSALTDLGEVARSRREYGVARGLYCEALASFATLDHWRGVARLFESFASLAADVGDAERGVRLAAAAAALRNRIGTPASPSVQKGIAASLNLLRQTLGPDAARSAWLEGAAMSTEEAIRLATLGSCSTPARGEAP